MQVRLKAVDAAQLTAAAVTYYTAPASIGASQVIHWVVCNTDTVARTVTIHVIPSGGSATATNKVLDAKQLQPNQSYNVKELIGKALEAGDFIQALASAATAISMQGSVTEITY